MLQVDPSLLKSIPLLLNDETIGPIVTFSLFHICLLEPSPENTFSVLITSEANCIYTAVHDKEFPVGACNSV